ncbi:hypothetical protein STRCI_007872 [Streptomyces cinnabarinus]|uniref:Lipoprotein n=1 Tax=Streptomyces cinnabarinus TaxID=67287 RepID=A0ABY7KP15_9ACTN|nr:hypothetical protein [Streptomyces cinnabarinus]WAZ26309.1 hypothetical protein STRCI_007872 [Streptomyces cinnabarinus]
MTITTARAQAVGRAVAGAVLVLTVAGGCAAESRPSLPSSERGRSDLIKAAQRVLVDRCMTARGAAGPPPQEKALFGAGRAELSVTLATGHTVRTHTDGCLAEAHRSLYGDQARWFRAEVVVNNLRPEAQAALTKDPGYRAALARRAACPDQDTRCVRASGLDALRARLEPARLAEARAAHRTEITTYDQLRDRAVHRAADLLATQPTPHRKGHTPS